MGKESVKYQPINGVLIFKNGNTNAELVWHEPIMPLGTKLVMKISMGANPIAPNMTIVDSCNTQDVILRFQAKNNVFRN